MQYHLLKYAYIIIFDLFPLFHSLSYPIFRGSSHTTLRQRHSLCWCLCCQLHGRSSPECDIWWQYIAFPTRQQRHFIFTYIWIMPPKQTSFGALRRDRMWDCADFTQPGLINLPVHSVHKGGSSFTGESSRYTTATQMRAIPLGGPSTLGIKNRTYQKPAARGLAQSFIVSWDRREWTLLTTSPLFLFSLFHPHQTLASSWLV